MLFWILATVYFFIATVFFTFISRDQVYLSDDAFLICNWIISIGWPLFLVTLLLYAIYFYGRKLIKKFKKNE